MADKALGDPEIYPSDEVLASHLGARAFAAFSEMLERNRAGLPGSEDRWKYYNDGKLWLFNYSFKKKTLFWLSVEDGRFRTTFYLGPKAEDAVLGSAIPDELKAQYRDAKGRGAKMRGVTATIRTKKDLAVYEALLAIKLATM